jgi:hypothetical protein
MGFSQQPNTQLYALSLPKSTLNEWLNEKHNFLWEEKDTKDRNRILKEREHENFCFYI